MAIFALVVAVLLSAALAAVGYVFYRRLSNRIQAVSSLRSRYEVMPEPGVYSAASDSEAVADIVGAWALEQERKGVEVSDEQMEVQRRMWMEFAQ